MKAEAVGLNHLADKVELAGKLDKPELSEAEIIKIVQEIYEKWDAAGLNGDDLKAVITPEGTVDYKKIEALIASKKLKASPLELTAIASEANAMQKHLGVMHLKSIAAEVAGGKDIEIKATRDQLRAHNMTEAEIDSMLRAKNLALRDDGLYAEPEVKDKLNNIAKNYDTLGKMRNEKSIMEGKLRHDYAAKHGMELKRFGGLESLHELFKILTNPKDKAAQAEGQALLKIEPNIFIFSDEALDTAFARKDEDILLPEVLDLPFRTCLIEAYSLIGAQSIVRSTGLGGQWGSMHATSREQASLMVSVPMLFVHEVTAKHYEIVGALMLSSVSGTPPIYFPFICSLKEGFITNLRIIDKMTVEDPVFTSILFNGIKKVLWRLTNLEGYKSGTVRTNIRVKGKSKGQTYFHKIKQVIYLGLKHESTKATKIDGESVDWSHRWEVRGHWRKCRGIGKDREGLHNVRGFTWVVPHIKGDEALPLIKKIRADLPPKESQ